MGVLEKCTDVLFFLLQISHACCTLFFFCNRPEDMSPSLYSSSLEDMMLTTVEQNQAEFMYPVRRTRHPGLHSHGFAGVNGPGNADRWRRMENLVQAK